MSEIETAIRAALVGGKLPCVVAHSVAAGGGWTPAQVGAEADRIGIKVSLCQLGLFGYREFGRKDMLQKLLHIPEDLQEALQEAADGGSVSCGAVWDIGGRHGLPRALAGSVAETLGLVVGPCQLGCFPKEGMRHRRK